MFRFIVDQMVSVRLIVSCTVVLICLAGIGTFFWKQELKYNLPTPVPVNYKPVNPGQVIDLPTLAKNKAYFLHFYNPDCPCSRFNARHLKSLIRSYSDSITVVVVVPSDSDVSTVKRELSETLEVLVDSEDAIAKACGVYSTPQAVIIDHNSKLYYRGNYNRTRYCTARASNFAELSLIALLNNQPSPSFGLMATTSYGCSLEPDKKNNYPELF